MLVSQYLTSWLTADGSLGISWVLTGDLMVSFRRNEGDSMEFDVFSLSGDSWIFFTEFNGTHGI